MIEITKSDCSKWYEGLDKSQAKMVDSAVMVLKLILNNAKKFDLITKSPADVIQRKKTSRTTAQTIGNALLTENEVLDLIEVTPSKYRLITVLGAYCGLRIGEALALQRDDIDLKNLTVRVNKQVQYSAGVAHITEPKTPKSKRTVPIPDEAVGYFKEHLANYTQRFPKSYLFARPTDSKPLARTYYNDKVFNKARKEIGRSTFRFHDLRHTCLTHYARGGATIKDLMAIAGHSMAEIAILYQETSDTRLRELASQFNYNHNIHLKDYQGTVNNG
ncbi:MAG: site-specific integrase [Bifidobacteriaceae bacterium]|jgi:integrase|nr:site-specific integrase [Bifidobacteriaceae bacterium]